MNGVKADKDYVSMLEETYRVCDGAQVFLPENQWGRYDTKLGKVFNAHKEQLIKIKNGTLPDAEKIEKMKNLFNTAQDELLNTREQFHRMHAEYGKGAGELIELQTNLHVRGVALSVRCAGHIPEFDEHPDAEGRQCVWDNLYVLKGIDMEKPGFLERVVHAAEEAIEACGDIPLACPGMF